MSNDPKQKVLMLLIRHHIGKGNGISMRQMEKQLSLLPRAIRTHISDLREDGIALCGTPKDGYYIAKTAEELQQTCDFLRNRAMHSLTLESRLRRIPLTDLLGQLHLPT